MWHTITDKNGLGGTTNFDFHFVPQLMTKTEAGKVDMEKTWREIRGKDEMRGIIVLTICTIILGGLGWTGQWVFVRLLQLIGMVLFSPNNFSIISHNVPA